MRGLEVCLRALKSQTFSFAGASTFSWLRKRVLDVGDSGAYVSFLSFSSSGSVWHLASERARMLSAHVLFLDFSEHRQPDRF